MEKKNNTSSDSELFNELMDLHNRTTVSKENGMTVTKVQYDDRIVTTIADGHGREMESTLMLNA
jgi:hypothetical protein